MSLVQRPSGDAGREALLALARRGDREAFEGVVRLFWDSVMRFFWRRLPTEDARDQTQSVFVSLYRSLRAGSGPLDSEESSWRRYLLVAARNHLRDFRRRQSARPTLSRLDDLFDDGSWEELLPRVEPSDAGWVWLVSREQSDAIRDCLSRLEALARSIVWLHFVESKPKREVARVLERPESSVRATLAAALKSITHCLEEKGMGPEPRPRPIA